MLTGTLTVTDTEIIISENCINRTTMNEDESVVDNENEEEDEVLEDPPPSEDVEDVEDEDREKDDDAVAEENPSKRRTKRQKKNDIKEEKKQKYDAAISAFKSGHYKSVNACAKDFGLNQSSLALYLKAGKGFVGGGKQSKVFTTDEEKRIVQFVTDRVNLGAGVDIDQLKSVIQELLIELKKADKERYIPPTWENCYPEDTFVRRFADRNRISLRRTMALSAARARLTPYDLKQW